jgi:Phage integrase family
LEGKRLFILHRDSFRRLCEIRWDFENRPPEQRRQRILLSEKLHSHIFRATGATLMAAAGMNIVSLSMLMGLASTETTQRYYLDAKQMNLPGEVQKICLRIQDAIESQQYSVTSAHSSFGWYERKGYRYNRKGYKCQSRSNEWLRTISHLTQHSSRFLPLRGYRTMISLHSSLISFTG